MSAKVRSDTVCSNQSEPIVPSQVIALVRMQSVGGRPESGFKTTIFFRIQERHRSPVERCVDFFAPRTLWVVSRQRKTKSHDVTFRVTFNVFSGRFPIASS